MAKFNIQKNEVASVLLFHRIGDPNSGAEPISDGLKCHPKNFEKTIQYFIKKGFNFISLDELYDIIKSKPKNNKNICITFDDGYKDNLTDLLPIAKKYNVPFAIYVAAYAPEGKLFTWWNTLEELLFANDSLELSDGCRYNCKTIDEKWSAFWQLREKVIKLANGKELEDTFKNLFSKYSYDPYHYAKDQYLSWEEIQELDNEPLCTIALHTCTHLAMDVASEQTIIQEMDESIQILENKLSHKIEHFAYPFGLYNDKTVEIMKQYQDRIKTFTTTDHFNVPENCDLLLIPRLHSIEKILFEKISLIKKIKERKKKMFKKLKNKMRKFSEKINLKIMFKTYKNLEKTNYPKGWNWIDRVYIDDFLEQNKQYITGDVLEFKDDMYIKKFGHTISSFDVMTHPSDSENKAATIFGDIAQVDNLIESKYDCIVCTQVLPFIYDFEKGIAGLKKMLKPDGVLLVSVPGLISLVATAEMKETGHFFGFSPVAMKKAFEKYFDHLEILRYGNKMAALLWMGFGDSTLLSKETLLKNSDDHIITVCVKAKKGEL